MDDFEDNEGGKEEIPEIIETKNKNPDNEKIGNFSFSISENKMPDIHENFNNKPNQRIQSAKQETSRFQNLPDNSKLRKTSGEFKVVSHPIIHVNIHNFSLYFFVKPSPKVCKNVFSEKFSLPKKENNLQEEKVLVNFSQLNIFKRIDALIK